MEAKLIGYNMQGQPVYSWSGEFMQFVGSGEYLNQYKEMNKNKSVKDRMCDINKETNWLENVS